MEEKKDLFENLKTERLVLRKISIEDAKTLYDNIYNNLDYYKFYYQIPFNSFDDFKLLIEKYEKYYQNGNYFKWAITLKENNKAIGVIQLHCKDYLNNNCKIGYIIDPNYKKMGYATEATKKVLDFGINKLKFHRIDAAIVKENIESLKLVKRIGMIFDYEIKDSYKINDKYYDQYVYTMISTNNLINDEERNKNG